MSDYGQKTMNIEIRKANLEDAQLVALLGRITFADAFGSFWAEHLHDYLEKTFSVEKIRSSLSKENNVFFLAFADGLPVGYAKLKKHSPNESLTDKSHAECLARNSRLLTLRSRAAASRRVAGTRNSGSCFETAASPPPQHEGRGFAANFEFRL